jgi:hypothetical protein
MNDSNKRVVADPVVKLKPSIELAGSPDDATHVIRLVRRFRVCRRGDVPEEAAVRLASLALVLANIAAGHLRGRAEGHEYDLGVDFVVEGGMAAENFASSVIGPVDWIQARWERNLLHDVTSGAQGRKAKRDRVKQAQDGDNPGAHVLRL